MMGTANIHDSQLAFAPVSVIIPCYRCADTIARAVASVARQSLRPETVILIDDLSDDGTLDELYRLQQEYPAGWIVVLAKAGNDGPGAARNIGWESEHQSVAAAPLTMMHNRLGSSCRKPSS